MSPKSVFLLRQPSINRSVDFTDLKNGKVLLDGQEFESFKDAEDYLINIERTDIE